MSGKAGAACRAGPLCTAPADQFCVQPLRVQRGWSSAADIGSIISVAGLLRRTFNADANKLSGLAIEAEHVQGLVERCTENILLVARSDDTLVGFAEVFTPDFLSKKGGVYPERVRKALKPYVASLAVDQRWQSRGAGRALMLAAESSALKAGYSCITLEVEATNTAALALYNSLGGYEQVGCDENGRRLVGDVFFGRSRRVCKLTLEKRLYSERY